MNAGELDYLKSKSKQDFEILKKWTTSVMTPEEAHENLRSLIGTQIQKMLDSNVKSLLDILYQTDISEAKVKACFSLDKTSREIGLEMADLYLMRLQQKWSTRQQFKTDIEGDW